MKINESPFVRYPKPASRFFKMNFEGRGEKKGGPEKRQRKGPEDTSEEKTLDLGLSLKNWKRLHKQRMPNFLWNPFPCDSQNFCFGWKVTNNKNNKNIRQEKLNIKKKKN